MMEPPLLFRNLQLRVGHPLRAKGLADCAPGTVFLIECWDGDNVVRFGAPGNKPGQPPIVVNGDVKCPYPALEDYDGKGAGTKAADGQWVLPANAPAAEGAYRCLRSFAWLARDKKKDIRIDAESYHNGRINVLFCDQHAESIDCDVLFAQPPVDTSGPEVKVLNPLWTRTED